MIECAFAFITAGEDLILRHFRQRCREKSEGKRGCDRRLRPGGAAKPLDSRERLKERHGQVRFVQEDEAVMRCKPRIDRRRKISAAIAAE